MADETKHTAAPWALGDENNESCEVQAGPVRISLDRADPFTGALVISREEMLANAHLVVAAPEMLAMLVKNEDFINDQYGISEDLIELRALIAKARGQR